MPITAAGAGTSAQGAAKWAEGRDMWCKRCDMQYCLYCGEKVGTLVKWHTNKTCSQFLKEVENSKAVAERKKLEDKVNAGYVTTNLSVCTAKF